MLFLAQFEQSHCISRHLPNVSALQPLTAGLVVVVRCLSTLQWKQTDQSYWALYCSPEVAVATNLSALSATPSSHHPGLERRAACGTALDRGDLRVGPAALTKRPPRCVGPIAWTRTAVPRRAAFRPMTTVYAGRRLPVHRVGGEVTVS